MPKAPAVRPPVSEKRPTVLSLHGDTRIDDYFWLREKEAPQVMEYLRAENAYTQAVMAPTRELQETLYRELLGRIKETDISAPVELEGYSYYERTQEGLSYSIHCRRHGTSKEEEVLLDENILAQDEEYFSLGSFSVSPDQRFLAYSTDTQGSESYRLFIKNLQSGELVSGPIENTAAGVAFDAESRTLFYATLSQTKRPDRVFRHRIGDDPAGDVLVFHESDEAFFCLPYLSKSRRFIFIESQSVLTSEVHVLPADSPTDPLRCLAARETGVEYHAEHQEEYIILRTNWQGATNFKIMRAPLTAQGKEGWEELVAHDPQVKISDVEVFARQLVLLERRQGLSHIRTVTPRGEPALSVSFPEPAYTASLGANPRYETSLLRFHYSSLVTPDSVFDFDMESGGQTLLKQQEVLGGYDPTAYTSQRLFASARDGTAIPISLVYKNDLAQGGKKPLWLYGYGSYGLNSEPRFSSLRLSLLDRGFIFAIAHIRGGCEMGEAHWHEGKLFQKTNTFTDFITCARTLIERRYTSPEKLIVHGGSAGGLLMGAVTNMAPELFYGVVAEVPFVDVLTTILDPSLPLSVHEYEEWGDPNTPEAYHYMKSYSPYDNVSAQNYPHMLVTAGLNDPRVSYWEPAKWVAKLRALKTNNTHLLLKTNMGAGHFGVSGRYDYLREVTFKYAFVLSLPGLKA